MKKFLVVIILLIAACGIYSIYNSESSLPKEVITLDHSTEDKLATHVKEVQLFISKNPKYNDAIAFFIDMKIHSGKNRFFIYDLKKNEVIDQGLVAHGSGSETGIVGELKFSNANNSLSTSLGKYCIGASYNGRFGKAYKLYGLDTTNSNAFERNVVLHKYSKVPYEEQEDAICNSLGCPMVHEKFFERIENILDNSEKSIILEIYY
jgi:hypothetical protein